MSTSRSYSERVSDVKRKALPLERKRVKFAKELEVVHILPPCETANDAEEEGTLATGENTSDQHRTIELTVLSSVHGRARRELREISVFDLQSAIKYGVMTRAHRCHKTGLPRWQYVYGNVVYITDHTSTKEVTSYKQAIAIQPATITPEMSTRHAQDLQTLQDDPHLCATHAIIIIDQSGSMRTSDVKGFRNRSRAAYGVLALEYIAEQLHQQGDSGVALDAVSIIEMNDTATLLYDKEPLDWILFNKILKRQTTSKPKSHGNYQNSLLQAKWLIDRELTAAVGVDPDDLPAFSIILLSDGKPSDNTPEDRVMQLRILMELARTLKSNFSFHAIGLGQSTADFQVLQGMALIAKKSGSDGTFSFAELSGAQLSAAFTSASTSMTATRTEKLAINGEAVPREKKDVQLRSKSIPAAERKFRQFTNKISRWKYDHQKYTEDEWPWTKKCLKNHSACAFDMEVSPFGKGAERLAFSFYEVDRQHKRVGKNMVAKETISINNEDRKIKFHETFCRVQRRANELAKNFNKAVKKSPSLWTTDKSLKTPNIEFLECCVYQHRATDGTICGVLVENFLKGKFTKYNSNNGFVKSTKGDRTIDLVAGEVCTTDFLQAFSHWVYHTTDQQLLVCDLQGVLNEEGRHPKFQLTDPCICSRKTRGRKKCFGRSDMGNKGFRGFRKSHKCNGVCKGLGLPSFGMKQHGRGI